MLAVWVRGFGKRVGFRVTTLRGGNNAFHFCENVVVRSRWSLLLLDPSICGKKKKKSRHVFIVGRSRIVYGRHVQGGGH